jgi:predicted dehydrogenase
VNGASGLRASSRLQSAFRRGKPRKARIGIVGAGWWATEAHLPSLLAYDRAEVVGIADTSPERLAAAAVAYGIEDTYQDHRQLIEAASPDAVIVATPHAEHFGIARDALAAGANVLVEKPMTLDVGDADELVRLAEERRLHLVVGYTWHFNPQAQQIRALIAAGRIGQIQLAVVLQTSRVIEFLRGRPDRYQDARKFPVSAPGAATYSDPAVAGGGQGQTQVTHASALLFWLTGLQPAEVSAYNESFDLAVDLSAAISFRFDGGALGSIASIGSIHPQHPEQLELRLFGTDGVIVADLVAGSGTVYGARGQAEQLTTLSRNDVYPLHAPARHLADLVLAETENLAPGTLGALTVAFVDAAYRSGRNGRAQPVRP